MASLSAGLFDHGFQPLPLLGNPHVQTILGAYLPGRACSRPQRQHIVGLPDGDALLLHENSPPTWLPHQPAALLVHGLTGCHASPHIRRLAALLLERGVRVFRIDLRGTGAGVTLARRGYHAGRSEDLRTSLAYIHDLAPASPLLLAGVSLGAAIGLKLAGELPEHPVPGLVRVAALNPPIDLERCSRLLEQPQNRFYERRFARGLVEEALRRHRHFPDLPELRFPRRLSVREFDDLYTAPQAGFAGALDYYRRASSFPLIPRIPLHTLILTARDDPFIAVEPFEDLQAPPHVHVHIAPRGGHVGFVGWDRGGGVRWAEHTLADWLCADGCLSC
jgi:predicted alpha/beta-fold hydrolase